MWKRRHQSAQAMAFLLAGRKGTRYEDWDRALSERLQCLLDLPDTATQHGQLMAPMHNNTMERAIDGLWSTRERTLTSAVTNELLGDIQLWRGERRDSEAARGCLEEGE